MHSQVGWLLMKLTELFAATKARWPAEIDISDAEVLSDGGFRCWEQVKLVERIRESFEEHAGLTAAAIWPFHQALGKVSRELVSAGGEKVSPDQVRIEDFEQFLLSTLADESWSDEREEYLKCN